MHLMQYKKQLRAFDESIVYAQQILYHEPLREEIHREIMRLYVDSGQRGLAIRHYNKCCKILHEELNIPPMRETQELYAQILQSAGGGQVSSPPRPIHQTNPAIEAGSLEHLQQTLINILFGLEKVFEQQQRTNQRLDQLIKNH